VLELRPVGAPSKGDALRALLDEHGPAAAILLGDDPSDALAFDVLRAARSAGECDGLAIAVVARADVLALVAPRADLVLGGATDAARFLSGLARALGERS
jgi:trehalose-6-phosphatase